MARFLVGVDIGGTFIDYLVHDSFGRITATNAASYAGRLGLTQSVNSVRRYKSLSV